MVLGAINGTVQLLQVSEANMAADITNILDFMMDNSDRQRVLVLCGLTCVRELFRQVRPDNRCTCTAPCLYGDVFTVPCDNQQYCTG